MALQSFVDKVGPVVSAAWLNAVDILKFTIFGDATTKTQARTNLTSDAAMEIANGGTGVRTLPALKQAIGEELLAVTGTADAIILTPVVAVTAYFTGQRVWWIASGANTTAVTVQVSALAAKALTKRGTIPLVADDIPNGALVGATYDGTQFQLGIIYTLPASPFIATGIELGHATDTTLSRASAGKAAVEGQTLVSVNTVVATDTIASGTYTPIITNVANVAVSVARVCQFLRVGSVVTVSGQCNIDSTTISTTTRFRLSLPIASAFATAFQCGGSAVHMEASGAGTMVGWTIEADAVNDEAAFRCTNNPTDTDTVLTFSFSYLVV